jgi:hypothetical protein
MLFYDIMRQVRVPAAIPSVDASNCYDRIAHTIASLVFQAFGVPSIAIETMLGTIENMNFFLRTGFGDSTSFAGGGISVKTQGLTQGNGASPAGWAVISIFIIGAHGKKGHGAKFHCPVTNLKHHLSAILYIDDTNLLHINLSKNETVDEIHQAIQDILYSWGNLLIATGGVLHRSNGKMGRGPMPTMHGVVNLESKFPSQRGRRRLLLTSKLIMQRRPWEQ